MLRFLFRTIGFTLCLTATLSYAAPKQLITHNTTDLESNAFIVGTIPSQHPTPAHSDGRVFWATVKMSCFGHLQNGMCPALIRVGTNTANPLDVGMVYLNVDTGEITPSTVHGNGYTLLVNGLAETTLLKD